MAIYSLKNRLLRSYRDFNRWSFLVLLIGLLIGIPVFTIFGKLFGRPGEMWEHIVEHLLSIYLTNTLILVIGCTVFTLLFGVLSAWLVTRYEFPFRQISEWFLILPLAIPSYITAYAYVGVFDFGGSLQVLLRNIGINFQKLDVMNIYGLIWILSLSLFPYVYVSARAAFLHQSKSLMEAAHLLGASEQRFFFTIALPLARPAIIGGLVLVLMEVLNDYGAAKYYGVRTFTTGIFRSWFDLEDSETAIYLSAILVAIIFGLMLFERWQRGHTGYASPTDKAKFNLKITLIGWRKWLAIFFVSIPAFFGFILPVLQLFYWAYLTYATVLNADFFSITLQSLGIALITATVTTMTAFFLIYFTRWNQLKSIKIFAKSATIGYAIPGAVIAIGVMLPTIAIDKFLIHFLYENFNIRIGLLINGTILALVYAYLVRLLIVAYNPLVASSLKVGKHLSESSNLLGVGALSTLFKIELPLLKTGFLSAFILVFVDVLKELPLTLILKPYDIHTLAVKAYEYASDERIAEAALPALCIIATGVLFVIVLNKMIRA